MLLLSKVLHIVFRHVKIVIQPVLEGEKEVIGFPFPCHNAACNSPPAALSV